MPYDVTGAINAGHSMSDIADYLAAQKQYNIAGARQAGYSDEQIVNHLNGVPNASAATPSAPSRGTTLTVLSPDGTQTRTITTLPGLTDDQVHDVAMKARADFAADLAAGKGAPSQAPARGTL